MTTTTLSSKGQVIIPKPIRTAHQWEAGRKLEVLDIGDGVILRTAAAFPAKKLKEAAGCLKYTGAPKTLRDMQDAIRRGVREHEPS